MLVYDAVRWLVASLKWLVRCKYIAVFHLCAFHNTIESSLLLGTRREKSRSSEQTNAILLHAFYCLPIAY